MNKPKTKSQEATTVATTAQAAQAAQSAQSAQSAPSGQEELTPARAAIILIEAVDAAQKAGGVYTLEEAAFLATCKRVLLSAITPAPTAETAQTQEV